MRRPYAAGATTVGGTVPLPLDAIASESPPRQPDGDAAAAAGGTTPFPLDSVAPELSQGQSDTDTAAGTIPLPVDESAIGGGIVVGKFVRSNRISSIHRKVGIQTFIARS